MSFFAYYSDILLHIFWFIWLLLFSCIFFGVKFWILGHLCWILCSFVGFCVSFIKFCWNFLIFYNIRTQRQPLNDMFFSLTVVTFLGEREMKIRRGKQKARDTLCGTGTGHEDRYTVRLWNSNWDSTPEDGA